LPTKEIAMVAAIAGIFALTAQLPALGLWKSIPMALVAAAVAAGVYAWLMPIIIKKIAASLPDAAEPEANQTDFADPADTDSSEPSAKR
jgi:hypothetical protein